VGVITLVLLFNGWRDETAIRQSNEKSMVAHELDRDPTAAVHRLVYSLFDSKDFLASSRFRARTKTAENPCSACALKPLFCYLFSSSASVKVVNARLFFGIHRLSSRSFALIIR